MKQKVVKTLIGATAASGLAPVGLLIAENKSTSLSNQMLVTYDQDIKLRSTANEGEEVDDEEVDDEEGTTTDEVTPASEPTVTQHTIVIKQNVLSYEFTDIAIEHVVIDKIALENILIDNEQVHDYSNLTFSLFLGQEDITTKTNEYNLVFDSTNGSLKTVVDKEIKNLENLSIKVTDKTNNVFAFTNKFSLSVIEKVFSNKQNTNNHFSWALLLGSVFGSIFTIGLILSGSWYIRSKIKDK